MDSRADAETLRAGGDPRSTGGGGTLWGKLEESCRYWTGLPKPQVEARVVEFQSERQFVSLLHQGKPVAVAFTFSCAHTQHFDEMFRQASAELQPHVNFVRVDCPKHLGFCIARQRKDYPFIEIFYNSREAQRDPRPSVGGATGVVRYSVMVLPYNYDVSTYGFREFFKKHQLFPLERGMNQRQTPQAL